MNADETNVALVAGEALIDIVKLPDGHTTAYPGGSAANVAVALARLERPVWLSTCFADDAYGMLISQQLDDAGVQLASDPIAVRRTSTAVAMIGPGGAADYKFDLDWQLNPLALDQTQVPLVVHTSSLAAVLKPGSDEVLALVERLRETATISFDINARPSVTGTGPAVIERVEHLVGLCDVVKASDEDLEALWPDRTVDESANALLALGPVVVVVTRGDDGASWVTNVGSGSVSPVAVKVADTIGSGDTFGAAMIDALWSRDLLGAPRREALGASGADVWDEVLGWAVRVAAVTVSRPGSDPPYLHELK